jgi:hypothetical protein
LNIGSSIGRTDASVFVEPADMVLGVKLKTMAGKAQVADPRMELFFTSSVQACFTPYGPFETADIPRACRDVCL